MYPRSHIYLVFAHEQPESTKVEERQQYNFLT